MALCYRWFAFLAATTGCLLLGGTTTEVAPEVRDDGKFFSAAAVKKADSIADRLRRPLGHNPSAQAA
jgi:hypothetical protein